jgi:hypothetical protein
LRVLALLVPILGLVGLFVFLIHSMSEIKRQEPTLNLFGARPKGILSGTVTLNGKLLPYGRISFEREDRTSIWTAEIKNGKYQVANSRAFRDMKVMVLTSFAPERVVEVERELARLRHLGKVPGQPPQEVQDNEERLGELEVDLRRLKSVDPVPARYEKPETTPFTFTPEKGSQEFDLRLEDP